MHKSPVQNAPVVCVRGPVECAAFAAKPMCVLSTMSPPQCKSKIVDLVMKILDPWLRFRFTAPLALNKLRSLNWKPVELVTSLAQKIKVHGLYGKEVNRGKSLAKLSPPRS